MARFGQKLRGKVSKVDNERAARAAKITIRRNVLHEVGSNAAVFDAFAGQGDMARAAWSGAAACVGCDQRWFRDERLAYVADNRRVLRAISLAPYAIFDLDAYSAPWEQALIIAARRPVDKGEKVGLVLTCGEGLKVKFGGLPKAMAVLCGLRPGTAGISMNADRLTDLCIAGVAERMDCRILRRWQARGRKGSRMLYIGLVLEGTGATKAAPVHEFA